MICCCCNSCGCGSSCGCGGSCGFGCGCDSEDSLAPSLSQFPVYVSYPAFFAGDTAITGANQAIFALNGDTAVRRSRSCRG